MSGTSHGEMLTTVTRTQGSAGYVAIEIERFTGALQGRHGSFVLQHSGTMGQRDGQRLSITIVPDSGSDALQGIAGRFLLKSENGQHHFELECTLPA